jgi:hypothetical protein
MPAVVVDTATVAGLPEGVRFDVVVEPLFKLYVNI